MYSRLLNRWGKTNKHNGGLLFGRKTLQSFHAHSNLIYIKSFLFKRTFGNRKISKLITKLT